MTESSRHGRRSLAATILLTALLAATPRAAHAMGETATAKMRSADGKDLGAITLTETMAGLLLQISLKGVAAGPHGLHFHVTGKCEGDFASAGAIYNPFGAQHGVLNIEGPMTGDLPNAIATAAGDVEAEMASNSSVTLSKTSEEPLLDADGAALVLFELPDDHITDPEGNAGARIACGVIEAK